MGNGGLIGECSAAAARSRRLLREVALALLILVLAGCAGTRFESPPGEALRECEETWKGLWLGDPESGLLVVQKCRAFLVSVSEAGEPFAHEPIELNYTEHREQRYVVMIDRSKEDASTCSRAGCMDQVPDRSFVIAQYDLREDTLEIRLVDTRAAAQLIVDGKVHGTVTSKPKHLDVYIQGTSEDTLRVLDTPGLFDAEEPIVLERSSRRLAEVEAASEDDSPNQRPQ